MGIGQLFSGILSIPYCHICGLDPQTDIVDSHFARNSALSFYTNANKACHSAVLRRMTVLNDKIAFGKLRISLTISLA
ncbi:MAG: hypothetical protein LBV16_00395 [Elusimicrobiota bacterium]|jgi:hypothetical protein|nr:hypothetical protein [Elusimicrobiota bacterium]